ncbi:hypothetical protein BDZ94DRAFT_1246362 [Collybia nuda]|uniref:Uncharacterized protein n=1 Tax=Collybia nuda TaxID=64659 RepID=A0A9P5YGP3_9AGAR|nr:hypothetical protein BDZ94DRAFT_1246362 [Collybia nuda]
MSPRPILKQRSSAPSDHHLAVHFPPSPCLTTHTFAVYSASAYDRSPIVVSPNSCALPERGCPGRTYTLDDPVTPTPSAVKKGHPYGGRDLHPRAIAFNASRQQQQRHLSNDGDRTPTATSSSLPPLIPDLSSESEESDGFTSPPLESSYAPNRLRGLAISEDRYASYSSYDIDMYGSGATSPSALSFLPHPPVSPSYSIYGHTPVDDDVPTQKLRRRRERKHEPSRTPDRIPSGSGDAQENTTPTKSKKSRTCAFSRTLAARHAVSSFRIEDDGCLGGF